MTTFLFWVFITALGFVVVRYCVGKPLHVWLFVNRYKNEYHRGECNTREFLATNPGPIDVLCWWNGACSDLDFNSDDRYAQAVLDVLRLHPAVIANAEMDDYAL